MKTPETMTIDGVEYLVLGPSDGTDYGYQDGDGWAEVILGRSVFRPYTGPFDSQLSTPDGSCLELRPLENAIKLPQPPAGQELLKACATFLVDDIRGLDLDSVIDEACATSLLAKFIEELGNGE